MGAQIENKSITEYVYTSIVTNSRHSRMGRISIGYSNTICTTIPSIDLFAINMGEITFSKEGVALGSHHTTIFIVLCIAHQP
uniref:Uncharacterized protein n=1 Tax=Rodentolepis nana TaxID=102285 RepID=A0A0R3TE51_RODNA